MFYPRFKLTKYKTIILQIVLRASFSELKKLRAQMISLVSFLHRGEKTINVKMFEKLCMFKNHNSLSDRKESIDKTSKSLISPDLETLKRCKLFFKCCGKLLFHYHIIGMQ